MQTSSRRYLSSKGVLSQSPPRSVNRTRRFVSGVASGYISIICNIAYTAASVPLALHYLTKEEFGLWALAQQIAGYLLMLDLGVSFSLNRLIADQKNQVGSATYRDWLKNGAFAFVALGLLMFALGGVFCLLAPSLFSISSSLAGDLTNILLILTVVSSVSFSTRIFAAPLWAFQRMDAANLLASVSLVVNFAALRLFFKMNFGVYSLALAGVFPCFLIPFLTYVFCRKNNYYPSPLLGGSFRKDYLKRLFGFGKDVFELSIGSHVLQASQVMILSRVCGLETAALFAIGTKLYTLISQLIYKIIESSAPGLTDIFTSGNIQLFRTRLDQLVSLTLFCGLVGGLSFFFLNYYFVGIWTQGVFSWPQTNDVFLALMLIFTSFSKWLVGSFGILADFRSVRHLYLVEAALFLVGAGFLAPFFEIKGVLFAAFVCHVTVTIPFSFFAFGKATGLSKVFRPFAIATFLLCLFMFIQLSNLTFSDSSFRFLLLSFSFVTFLGLGVFFVLPREFARKAWPQFDSLKNLF